MLTNGDCAVIQTPTGKNVIIDGGNNQKYDYGENVVVPYLLDRKITKIDFLMVSHADSDHIGGLFAVLENLKVEVIIIGKQAEAYDNYVEFRKLAEKKNTKILAMEAGQSLPIDRYTKFEVLWPDAKNMIVENGINNNSLVGKLQYKDFSMLFTGDIEEIAEKEIVQMYKNSNILDCNILKAAHHGSKSSSIQEIIDLVKPQAAVIGVGEDNKYGHPNGDVLARFENCGCKIFRTDKHGEIMIKTNGKNIKVEEFIKNEETSRANT